MYYCCLLSREFLSYLEIGRGKQKRNIIFSKRNRVEYEDTGGCMK